MKLGKLNNLALIIFVGSTSNYQALAADTNTMDRNSQTTKSEVITDYQTSDADRSSTLDKKIRSALLEHYSRNSYFSTAYEEDEDNPAVKAAIDLEAHKKASRTKKRKKMDAYRSQIMDEVSINESQFVAALLNIALTEKYLEQADFNKLIYDLAFVETHQAAAALENIDRHLEQIATRTISLDDRLLRRTYNVPDSMSDDDFFKLLKKYRKSGMIPEHDPEEIAYKINTFCITSRDVIISSAMQSGNQHMIPLITSYLSLDGDEKYLAKYAQTALDDLSLSNAEK